MIDVEIEPDGCSAEESKYPYLGEFKDKTLIVLFTKKNTGFVIKDKDVDCGYSIGHNSSGWDEERQFTPFKGKITLSNK